jgi:hypothetical protein
MATPVSSTQAVTTAAVIGTPSLKRTALIIQSPAGAAADVWIGGSNVAASNGFRLQAGERVAFTNDGQGAHASQEWHAFAASSVTLQVTEAH